MSVHSLRLPPETEEAIAYVARHEKLEKAQSLRKLARLGFERYIARDYRDGRLSLRDVARMLGMSLSEAQDLLAELGVPGNLRLADVMASLDSLSRPPSGDPGR